MIDNDRGNPPESVSESQVTAALDQGFVRSEFLHLFHVALQQFVSVQERPANSEQPIPWSRAHTAIETLIDDLSWEQLGHLAEGIVVQLPRLRAREKSAGWPGRFYQLVTWFPCIRWEKSEELSGWLNITCQLHIGLVPPSERFWDFLHRLITELIKPSYPSVRVYRKRLERGANFRLTLGSRRRWWHQSALWVTEYLKKFLPAEYPPVLTARHQILCELAEKVPMVLCQYQLKRDGTIAFPFVSRGVATVFGVSAQDPTELSDLIVSRIHPEDFANIGKKLVTSSQTLEPIRCLYRLVKPHVKLCWVEGNSVPERQPDGTTVWNGFIHDVTEQVKAEQALRESETKYRTLMDHLDVGVVQHDTQDQVILANRRAMEILGLRLDDDGVTSLDPRWEFVNEQGLPFEGSEAPSQQVLRTLKPVKNFVLGTRNQKSGRRLWLQVNAVPLFDDAGQLQQVQTTFAEITERKIYEEALRESELRYRTLIETCTDGIFLMDLDCRILSVNSAGAKMYGYEIEELIGSSPEIFDAPGKSEPATLRNERIRSQAQARYETILRRKDGTTFSVEVLATRVFIHGKEFILTFDRDITERKRNQEALLASEYRQRIALDAARMGTWDWTISTHEILWDARELALFGYPEDHRELRSEDFYQRIHPDDLVRVQTQLANALKDHQEYETEFRICLPDGSIRWLMGKGRVIRDESGTPLRMVGVNYDLTEKKLAQLALEDSERRQRIALDSAQMGTWDWIIGTSRLTWDINQLRIFGFPPGGFDSTIESFIQRVYPEDLAHVQEVLHRASQGHDFAMEFRIIRHNDGAVRWIYGSGVVVHTDNGIPFKFVGINFDITERKVAEEFLRKSLKEKDAMLREIHHRVKNNLQVITSLLNLQNSRVANQELKRLIQESQDRIQAMALVHEMLYRSQNLAEIDLPKYLSELAQYLLRAYGNPGVEIDLQLQLSPAYIGLEKMIPCGLLVNEVITNSLKYAFLGRQRGVISLELAEDAGQIHLVIADDGVGMSQALEDQVSTTLGSKLILVLVEQLGANLEVHTDPGTRYSLKFQG